VPHGGGPTLIIDSVAVVEAERYGDCLTHPLGHADVWERWRALTGRERRRVGVPVAVVKHEYDDLPRGRIVSAASGERFKIYADRTLHDAPWPRRIIEAFVLDPDRCILVADAHYRTP